MNTLQEVIKTAKKVARNYRQLTGKPLGITGEIGERIIAKMKVFVDVFVRGVAT